MLAHRCDRCGNFFQSNPFLQVTDCNGNLIDIRMFGGNQIELCETCSESFDRWGEHRI